MTNPDFWRGKNVLITGHTGFKGSWLCLWLNKLGANIHGLSLETSVSKPNIFSVLNIKKLVNDHRGDVVNPNICRQIIIDNNIDIIIHMAAQALVRESYVNPLKTYNTNIIGTANILQGALESKTVRSILVVTTDKCYENIEKDYAYVETDPLGGYDPYSSSKACSEHVASAYYRSFFKQKNIGLATARAGNVIGGGDWSSDRLIPDMIKSWSKNKKLLIRYPMATRPWQHVLEPISGYLLLAESLWGNSAKFSGGWNFGPNKNSIKTVQDTVELSKKFWGNSANWMSSIEDHLHEANLLELNSEKSNLLLSWHPRFNFDEAVSNTINWYKTYYTNKQKIIKYTLNQILEYESRSINV